MSSNKEKFLKLAKSSPPAKKLSSKTKKNINVYKIEISSFLNRSALDNFILPKNNHIFENLPCGIDIKEEQRQPDKAYEHDEVDFISYETSPVNRTKNIATIAARSTRPIKTGRKSSINRNKSPLESSNIQAPVLSSTKNLSQKSPKEVKIDFSTPITTEINLDFGKKKSKKVTGTKSESKSEKSTTSNRYEIKFAAFTAIPYITTNHFILPISEGKLEEEKESAIGTGTTGSNGNGSMDLSRSSRTTTPEPVDQTDDRSIIFLNEHNNRSQAIKSNLPVAQFQNIILPENLRLSQKNRNKSSVISPSISTLPLTYYHSSHLLGPHLNKSINDDYEHDNVQNLMGIGDFREGKDRFLFPKNYSGFSSDNVPDKPERSCRVYYKNFQTGFENFLLPQNSHTQAEIKTKDLDGRIYINNFEHSSLEHFILSKLDPDFKKSLDSISTISEVSKASKESSSRRSLPSLSSKNAKKSRKRGRSSVCSKTSSKVEEIAKTFKKPVEIKKEQKSSISTSNITKISFDDFFCEKTTFMHPCCDETFKIVLQQEMYEEEQSKQRQAAEMKLKQKQQEQRKMQQKEEMKKAREKELQEKLIRQEKLRKTLKYNSKKADYLFWDSETDTRSDLEKFTLSVNPFRHRIKMKDFLPKKSSTFPSSSIKLPPKKRALDIQNEQAMKENFILPENVYKNCHKISVENFDTADKFVVSDCQFKRMRITEAAFVDGCHFILPRNEHENLIMEPRFEHFLTKMGENENYKSIQAEESHFLLPKSNSTLKSSDIQASNYFNKVEFSDFNTTDNRLLNNEHFMLPKFDDSLYQSLETMNYQEDESVEVYEIREDKWYKAKIVKFNMEKAEYYIHYQGWNNKYDFWLGFKDGRERIRRTSGQSSACTSNSKDDANTTTDELKVIPTYKIGQIVISD